MTILGLKKRLSLNTYLKSLGYTTNQSAAGVNPLVPGPLAAQITETSLTSWSRSFDLATPNLVFCIIGSGTSNVAFSVTHGGQALTQVGTTERVTSSGQNLFISWFAGNNLTIETANLVITATTGSFGPAMIVCNDDFGAGVIPSTFVGSANGNGTSTIPIPYPGTNGGKLLHAWISTNGPAPAIAQPSSNHLVRLAGFTTGGAKEAITPWTIFGTKWTESGGIYTHSGTSSNTLTHNFSPVLQGPIGYDLDVSIPAGGSITLSWRTSTGALTNRKYNGPFDGVINGLLQDASEYSSVVIYANGDVTFRGLSSLSNPKTIVGSIGRQIADSQTGDQITYYRVYNSSWATSAIKVGS